MSEPILSHTKPRDYLLVPPFPVANGNLHLGHIAGPYLRLDVLSRHLRRRGDRTRVIFGTDDYEPFLTIRATQEHKRPADLAAEYHPRVADDLAALRIGVDALIHPSTPTWRPRYAAAYYGLMQQLQATGLTERREETMLYAPGRSHFVVGCWLEGRCPVCSAEGGAFICEDCGAHYHTLLDPRSRRGEPVIPRRTDNLFFRIRDRQAVLEQLAGTEAPGQHQRLCQRHLARDESGLLRLTVPDSWGLAWRGQPWGDGTGVQATGGADLAIWPPGSENGGSPARFLVGQGLLLAYCRLCGDVYSELEGGPNPFDEGSDVVTVNGFGVDNVITHMVGIQAMAAALGMRPFERFVVNHFYLLAGEKFSTSRQHAIWSGDMIRSTPVTADAMRYYLALTSPTETRQNFDVEQFLWVVEHRLAERFNPRLADALGQLETRAPRPAESTEVEPLRQRLTEQEAALSFRCFDPLRALESLDRWLEQPAVQGSAESYWWLKGLSLLAEPLMPQMAQEIWHALGAAGTPSYAEALATTTPSVDAKVTPIPSVRYADLAGHLPTSLHRAAAA